ANYSIQSAQRQKRKKPLLRRPFPRPFCILLAAVLRMNRPLSSRQVKKEKLRHKGLVPVSKGSQTL
ncbi:hypothetical protein AACB49_17985, partial [Enterococcus faecium]|uniref:hypothetical protein n=1 Tax=Enterococcus faecium TaxID=1352 RepID=UPI003181F158